MKVFVTDEERRVIEARAAAAGLSVSAYLRTVGLNRTVRATADHKAVSDLARINADQGRLGGLLKLWLAEQPGRGIPEQEVRGLLTRIEAVQVRLAELAAKV